MYRSYFRLNPGSIHPNCQLGELTCSFSSGDMSRAAKNQVTTAYLPHGLETLLCQPTLTGEDENKEIFPTAYRALLSINLY